MKKYSFLALILVLWSAPASADPWYCSILRQAVKSYSSAEVTDFALKRGYSRRQITQAKKECHISALAPLTKPEVSIG